MKTRWNLLYHKNWWFLNFHCPLWMLMYFFVVFFYNLTWFMTKLRILVLCFPYFMDFSIFLNFFYKIEKKFERTFIMTFQFFIYIEHVHLNIHTINKLLFFWNPRYFFEAKFKNLMFEHDFSQCMTIKSFFFWIL